MCTKKELQERGYAFTKIGKDEYLDLSEQSQVEELSCPIADIQVELRNKFLKHSQKRGKALEIVLPLIDHEDMTDLLSELHDLRSESVQRKIEDDIAEEQIKDVIKEVKEIMSNTDILKQLNTSIDTKCRPKTQTKKPQKKKLAKK